MSVGNPVLEPALVAVPVIPEHELLRPIASGAYGQVWLARSALGTLRAVKIVRRDRFERTEDFEREWRGLQRFEPVSRTHEALVDILQIGRQDDWFYYVMELADNANPQGEPPTTESTTKGRPSSPGSPLPTPHSAFRNPHYTPLTLRQKIRDLGSLPAADVLALSHRLASALAHLHSQGLVHRDVKPSNILFVKGQPKLADAGLVAAVDDARSLVGTPGYIPPEGPGTPQADIYSLGKVLYEAAFGKDRQEFPQLPSDVGARPDHALVLELNEIMVKACAHDPQQRYASATDMLAELELLQRGASVRRAHAVADRWRLVRKVGLWGTPATLGLIVLMIAFQRPQRAEDPGSNRSSKLDAQSAYEFGLKYLSINQDITSAAENFEKAVKVDPTFLPAKAALAVTWCYPEVGTNQNFALLPRAKAMAEEVLARDPKQTQAHMVLGWHAALWEWNWARATQHFETALQLSPTNHQVHEWYGVVLGIMGKTNAAVEHLKKAIEQEPASPAYWRHFGLVLLGARRYPEALKATEKCVQLQRTEMNLSGLHEALERTGQTNRAIEISIESDRLGGFSAKIAEEHGEQLRQAWEKGGLPGLWRQELELYGETTSPITRAKMLASAGRVEPALDLLYRAYQEHNPWVVWFIKTGEDWDSLRDEPRFKKLLRLLRLE